MILRLLFLTLAIIASARADTVAVNHPALVAGLSPFNWEASGSSYIRAANSGAYFKVKFTGTTVGLAVDVAALSGAGIASKQYPRFKYRIDGGSFTTRQLLSSDTTITLGTGLTDDTHSLEVYLLATDAYVARWTAVSSLKITGIVVGTGKTLEGSPKRTNRTALWFGDSITEGAWSLLAPTDLSDYADATDGTVSYAKVVSDWLGVEYGMCAFGGQSWDSTFNSDVPALPSTYNLIKSGVSRTFGTPAYVFINMGTNGGVASSSTVSTFLGNLRSACGAATRIYVIIPFNQTGVTNITSGVTTYQAANPSDLCYLIDLGSTGSSIATSNSTDGSHLNPTGHSLIAAQITPSLGGTAWSVPPENIPYGGWVPGTNMGVVGGIPSRSGGTVINVTASPYNAAGVLTETTGTITSGGTSLVVADASSFAVGHSVRVGHKHVVDLVIDTGASSTGSIYVSYGTGTNTDFDRVVNIAVVSGDTAAQVAAKFRASTVFNYEWDVSGSGTTVRFTRKIAIAFGSGFSILNSDTKPNLGVTATPTIVTAGSAVVSTSKITAKVGNTLTLADAASASVTDAVVSHNDSTAINDAVNAAAPGDIVYIPAGQYRMDSQIYVLRKGITVRGAGMTTELHHLHYFGAGIYAGDNAYAGTPHTITAGLTAGSSTITIDDTTDFTEGRMLSIELANENAVPVFSVSGYPYRQTQVTKLISKTSTTLTVSPPLYASFPGTARVSCYTYAAEGFGVEDLQIFAYNQIQYVIYLERTAYSWVKNVKTNIGKNTHVSLNNCLGAEIRGSWLNELGNGVASNAGGILVNASSACLVEDTIIYKGFPLVEVNSSMGNAFLFNFLEDSSGQAFDDNHNAHSRFNLYEGNRVPGGITSDGYYGTGSHATTYGNRLNARPSAASTAGYAVVLNRGARNYVFANNIMATGSGDSNYNFGNPNLGNGSFEGTADHNSGIAWRHLKLDGTTPFTGTLTRTSDTQGTITLSGTGVTSDIDSPYFDAGNGNMRLWWNSYGNSVQVRRGTVSSSTVFVVNTHEDATVLPIDGASVALWVGALGFQERDAGVVASTTTVNNWSAITSATITGEAPGAGQTFPDSIAYPSGAPSWWSGSWPAYGAANYAVRDDARIPAHVRYLGGSPSSDPSSLSVGTLNVGTLNVGSITRAP